VLYPFDRYIKRQILVGRPTHVIRTFLVDEFGMLVADDFEVDVEQLKQELATVSPALKNGLEGKRERPPGKRLMARALETDVAMDDRVSVRLLEFSRVQPIREMVHALAMKQMDPGRIRMEVELRFQASLDPDVLHTYLLYFWDGTRMTFGDWFAYIQLMKGTEKSFYNEVMLSDLNRVVWMMGGQPEFNEEDFLRRFMAGAQQALLETVDPRMNTQRIPPRDWAIVYSTAREHFLDLRARQDEEKKREYMGRVKEASRKKPVNLIEGEYEVQPLVEKGAQVG